MSFKFGIKCFFSDLSNDHNQPSSGESGGGDSDTESRGGKGSSNKKRGLFPKQATNILRAWLFQNLSVSITTYASKTDQNIGQKKTWGWNTGISIGNVQRPKGTKQLNVD